MLPAHKILIFLSLSFGWVQVQNTAQRVPEHYSTLYKMSVSSVKYSTWLKGRQTTLERIAISLQPTCYNWFTAADAFKPEFTLIIISEVAPLRMRWIQTWK